MCTKVRSFPFSSLANNGFRVKLQSGKEKQAIPLTTLLDHPGNQGRSKRKGLGGEIGICREIEVVFDVC